MSSAEDLDQELESTRRKLAELTEAVALNDEIMRASQQRELRLLQAEDLHALFFELVAGLRESYGLEQVSVVLCDPDHDIRHLLLAEGPDSAEIEGLKLIDSLTGVAPQFVGLRRPWLGPFRACDHQLLFEGASSLGSLAMIPLAHRGELIGSINLGSSDASRFTPDHASDFLAHLGVIASYCVENVLNRARLLRSGFTDVLTGWHNRRYLQVRMREELARAQRDGSNLVCLMIDVDFFKRVNDAWGHAAGDAVLRDIAQRVESQVRASDIAARYGGEEFVVVVPDTDTRHSERLAERIRSVVSETPIALPNGESTSVTVSIGISSLRPPPDSDDLKSLADGLIARADVALYRAKAEGRDRVVVGEAA
jgi:diguanylate cyclase (GGDEF)-like protein